MSGKDTDGERMRSKERDSKDICMHLSIYVISMLFNKFRIYAEYGTKMVSKLKAALGLVLSVDLTLCPEPRRIQLTALINLLWP